jgi:hypothetical protein
MTRTIARGNITAKQACEWAGLDYDTYLKLVHDRCLAHTPAGGVDADYFVALYLFARLADRVGFETVRHVWPQIRAEMPPADESTAGYLKVYIGIPMPTARLLRSSEELDRIMADEQGGRIVELRPHLQKARGFFVERRTGGRKTAAAASIHVLEGGQR